MTEQELNKYCEGSALQWDVVRLLHNTLREDLRNDITMSAIEELAIKHGYDVIELAEQASEFIDLFPEANPAHNQTMIAREIPPFMSN